MADTTTSVERKRPDWAFVAAHPAHLLAFGFGAGLAPRAPGTFGTLVAFPLYWGLAPQFPGAWFGAVLVALFGVGVWACGVTGRALGVHDHGGMVWDEIVAFMLVLWMTPTGFALWPVAAFAVFRFFDVAKPPPIGWYDRRVHGGFGVMLDDLIAAFYTLIVLALVKTWLF